jgi:hypothetical protein
MYKTISADAELAQLAHELLFVEVGVGGTTRPFPSRCGEVAG